MNSAQNNECVTLGGETCQFPFIYDRMDDIPYVPATIVRWFFTTKEFKNCADFPNKSGKRWCATKVTSDNRYIPGHWGECPNKIACNSMEGE